MFEMQQAIGTSWTVENNVTTTKQWLHCILVATFLQVEED